ncbi:MAG: DNA gyrase subunit A [Clostridia bacterium]|nr:DNA gyrase subunit A [Clostridia bacterium]
MKKKDEEKKSLEKLFENTIVKKIEVGDELKKSFISYAMAVNVSRAIPDVRDGLKPVHRRILFSMGELNNYNDKPYKKCARIVGEVMGKYHPHGDSSVYDALVRLAQDFSIREPLVDGHGNFGSIDGDSPAAQRYTEARLSKIAGEMLRDIDKDTVNFYPNFDETLMQPRVLPAKFPNLLVNGADGIAVGMATNIPPHNLVEVINGVQALIDNPEIEIDDLIKLIPAPDYPTGGIIMGRTSVKHAYKTGRGGIILRGKAEIEEEGNRHRIIITELPYQVNKARFIMNMADLVKNKKIEGILDIREESDRDGMRVVVEIKKDANAQVVLNMLYKHTQLQTSDGIILLALVNGEPKIINLKEILYYYLEHQKEVLIRKTQFNLRKAEEREHIVRGLVIAVSNIDEVVKIIKNSKDRADALQQLMSKFYLSEKQANAILELKLAKLTGLEVGKLNDELIELEKLVAELKGILADNSKILKIIRDDLEQIKMNYGNPRKTVISTDLGGIEMEDLIKEEDVVVSLTHKGYIKRITMDEYKAQKRGGVGITAHKAKEEDFVENIYITSTHSNLLMFSNQGKVYRIKAYEIPEASRQAKGRAMINLLQLSAEEKISAIIPVDKELKDGFLIMATKDGLIKKTLLSEYENIRQNGKIAIKLNENDELIGVGFTKENDEIIIASSAGRCVRFNEKQVRSVGRTSLGVKSMNITKNESIIAMEVVRPGNQIITISENGFGKKTPVSEFRLTARGAKGVKAGNFNEKTGKMISLVQAEENEDDDLMLIADNGIMIRVPIKQISLVGRVSQGVKVMRLKDNAKLISVAIVSNDKGEDIELVESEVPNNGEVIETAESE